MSYLRKSKYLYTMLIVLIVLAVFSCISLVYVKNISDSLKQESRESIGNHIDDSAALVDSEFGNDLAMVDFFAVMLAEHPIYEFDDLRNFFYRYLVDVDKSNFARMSVILPDGTEYYMDGEISVVKDEINFEKNMKQQSTISEPYVDYYAGVNVIDVNVPIIVKGDVKAVVSAKKRTIEFEKKLASKFYYGNGYGFIINDDGDIMIMSLYQGAGSKFSLLEGKISDKNATHPFLNDLKLGNRGIVDYDIDGENFITAYMPLENCGGWNLVCMVPESVVNKRVSATVVGTVFVCLAIFALLFVLIAYILISRRKTIKEMTKLAYVDEVTGISNIHKFVKDTEDLFERYAKEEYVMLQFDIDKFKYVNELFGYEVGNELLRLVAKTLQKFKRAGELSARNASDNFVLIMKYTDDNDIIEKINKITGYIKIKAVEIIGKYELHIPWGIYKINKDDPNDIYELLDRTLIAKKSIKHSYHDTYALFSEEMRNRELKEKEIENTMETALKNEDFIVYIQPKFDMRTSRLVGGEALIRWKDGDTMISPGEFIPVFEKNGFVIKLDFFVLEKICQKIAEWIDEGLNVVPISINQSRLHLREPNYIDDLVKAVEKHDIPKKYIEFELTEGTICENPTEIKKVLDELQDYGFLTSIDDFGTGYSSLNILSELKVNVIKMDKGFLTVSSNMRSREIVVEQVISLAKNLNMKVVAEGVETEEQAQFLRDNGCDIVQGFLFARPMPISEFEKLLRNAS